MSERPTCGVLYQRALEHFTGMKSERISTFAAGFVCGQAEKVYLGACRGAMFRPSPEWWYHVERAVEEACKVWDLYWVAIGQELWLYHPDARDLMDELSRLFYGEKINTEAWHMVRGELCGIPDEAIDLRFHERPGYGEPADRPSPDAVAVNAQAVTTLAYRGANWRVLCGRCEQPLAGPMQVHEGIGLCSACAAAIAPSRQP